MAPTVINNSGWDVDVSRFGAAFARTSMGLMRETDERRLIERITNTCCAMATAELAACCLCDVDVDGKPFDMAEGNLFHISCVVGVTDEQRAFAQSMPLGSIGLLRPIFSYGSPVRINDIFAPDLKAYSSYLTDREASGDIFSPHIHDSAYTKPLQAIPLPAEHPPVRSFLGVPLLNYDGKVVGALLLGHSLPEHFSAYDELLTTGLATVAAVSLENIRAGHRSRLCTRDLKEQQALEAQRAMLQLIIDEMPGNVCLVHGLDARLVLMNRSASTLWPGRWEQGQPLSDFLRQSEITFCDENGVPISFEQLAVMRAIQQRRVTHQRLEELHYGDGRYVPMKVSASLISIPRWLWPTMRDVLSLQDRGPLAVVVHQDITASIDAEHLKDEFIDIAAHTLLSPLATLRDCAQTLMLQSKRGAGAPLTDWQVEAIESIEQTTVRMSELADHLLDVSRLRAGCLRIQPVPHDLVALVRRVVQRLQSTTDQFQLNVHTSLDHLLVEVDIDRIEQVLISLIQHIYAYGSSSGPIDLDITEGHESAHMGVAVVSIQSHSLCIPAEQQARMFEPFSRTPSAHGCDGTGLKLYLCRTLVERHQGQIWFESLADGYPTFYLTLPVYFEEKPVTCPLPNIL